MFTFTQSDYTANGGVRPWAPGIASALLVVWDKLLKVTTGLDPATALLVPASAAPLLVTLADAEDQKQSGVVSETFDGYGYARETDKDLTDLYAALATALGLTSSNNVAGNFVIGGFDTVCT